MGRRPGDGVGQEAADLGGGLVRKVASFLGEHGIFSWEGNSYALPLTEALGLEPDGVVRVGLLHYNTAEEVDRLIATLATLPT